MIERAHGLILRTRPFTDTSVIVHWLTAEHGRIHTVAKGARRPKSPLRGKIDLFYQVEFSFSRSRRTDLHTLSEVTLQCTREPLRRDLGFLRQASYAAELIEQTTEKETPIPGIYNLMRGFLDALPTSACQPHTLFAFELKLLSELGLQPDLESSPLTPGSKRLALTLSGQAWPAIAQLRLTAAQTNELRQFLHGFLIFHLGRLPKGRFPSR